MGFSETIGDFLGSDEDESESKIIKDEDKATQEQRFQQQCYLLEHMDKFHAFNRDHLYNRFAVLNGEPSIVVNELTKKPGVDKLFKLTPAQMSVLTPILRIYKVQYESENSRVGKDLELKFDAHLTRESVDSITANHGGRASGVGIESFEWEYYGKQPAETTTNIRAHLSIFFQNLEDLVKEGNLDQPGSTVKDEANFTDLFIFSKQYIRKDKGCESERVYNPRHFRIKAVVGWSLPPKTDLLSDDERAVIGSMQTVLMLDLAKHSINFNEDGSLNLKAEYIGSVENSLNHPASDVLAIGERIKKEEERVRRKKKCMAKEGPKPEDPNPEDPDPDPKEEEERVEAERSKDRIYKYNRLLQKLRDSKRMFFVDVPRASLGVTEDGDQLTRQQSAEKRSDPSGHNTGPDFQPQVAPTTEPLDSAIEKGADEEAKPKDVAEDVGEILTDSEEAASSDNIRVNFMYYGDIINAALEVLESPTHPAPANVGFVMGPITFYDTSVPKGQKPAKKMISLADVPISLNLFIAWWTDKVLKTGGRNNYFIKDFIRDTIKDLISVGISGACTKADLKQNNRIGINIISSRGKGPQGKTPRIQNNTRKNIEDIADNSLSPLPPGGERKKNEGLHHYVFIFSSNEPPDMFTGDRAEDFRRGIYHLNIGEESGILRSVKFSQVGQKFLKEANYARDGSGTESFFKERYNADVELFGNVLFYPGSQVFINPSIAGLGNSKSRNSLARRLGIGGYYLIKEIKNKIDSGGFQTDITCINVSSGEGKDKTPRDFNDEDGTGGIVKGLVGGDSADSPIADSLPGFGPSILGG